MLKEWLKGGNSRSYSKMEINWKVFQMNSEIKLHRQKISSFIFFYLIQSFFSSFSCLLAAYYRGWWCTGIPLPRVRKIDPNLLRRKKVSASNSPPPPPPNQLFHGLRDIRGWRRTEKNYMCPPPPPMIWFGLTPMGNFIINQRIDKWMLERKGVPKSRIQTWYRESGRKTSGLFWIVVSVA